MKNFKVISDGTTKGTSVMCDDKEIKCDLIKFEISIDNAASHLILGIPLSQVDLDISVDADKIKINRR